MAGQHALMFIDHLIFQAWIPIIQVHSPAISVAGTGRLHLWSRLRLFEIALRTICYVDGFNLYGYIRFVMSDALVDARSLYDFRNCFALHNDYYGLSDDDA